MAKKEIPYSGVFSGIDFPDYRYEHFPLMLTKGSGKSNDDQLVVNDQAELDAALAATLEDGSTLVGWKAPARVGPPVSLTEREVKDMTAERDAARAEVEALKAQLAAAAKPSGGGAGKAA